MTPSRAPTEQELYGRRGRLITDRDANKISRVEELAYELKVYEVMTAELQTASPDMPLSKVLEILRVNRISGVPVVQDDQLAGILSIEDIVRAISSADIALSVG